MSEYASVYVCDCESQVCYLIVVLLLCFLFVVAVVSLVVFVRC